MEPKVKKEETPGVSWAMGWILYLFYCRMRPLEVNSWGMTRLPPPITLTAI